LSRAQFIKKCELFCKYSSVLADGTKFILITILFFAFVKLVPAWALFALNNNN
jgi:hypothetical protein